MLDKLHLLWSMSYVALCCTLQSCTTAPPPGYPSIKSENGEKGWSINTTFLSWPLHPSQHTLPGIFAFSSLSAHFKSKNDLIIKHQIPNHKFRNGDLYAGGGVLLCIPIQQPVIRRPIINSDMATFHKLRHRNINSVSHLVKSVASDNHFFNNLVGSCYYVFIILLGAACFEAAAVRWGGAGGAAAPLHAVCCTSLQCSAAPQRGGGGCQMSNRRNVQMPPTLPPLVRAALCHHVLWAGPGMLELVRHLGPRIQNIYHLSWLWPSYPSSPHRSMALYTSVQCPRCWRGIRRWRGDTAAMGRCAGPLVALSGTTQPSLELPSVSLHNHGETALNSGGRCWPGNHSTRPRGNVAFVLLSSGQHLRCGL